MSLLTPFSFDDFSGFSGADAYRAKMLELSRAVDSGVMSREDSWSEFRAYALRGVKDASLPPFQGEPNIEGPTPWYTDSMGALWTMDVNGPVVRPDYTVAVRYVNASTGEENIIRGEQTSVPPLDVTAPPTNRENVNPSMGAERAPDPFTDEQILALGKRGWTAPLVIETLKCLASQGESALSAWQKMMRGGPSASYAADAPGQGSVVTEPTPVSPLSQASMAIDKGSVWLKEHAERAASGALAGDRYVLVHLEEERKKAHAGNWLAQQYLTFVQSALNRMGGNVALATWRGEEVTTVVGVEDPLKTECLSVIERALHGDQNAQALLERLPHAAREGSTKAILALRFIEEILRGGKARMGLEHMKADIRGAQLKIKPKKHPGHKRHPALQRLGRPLMLKETIHLSLGQRHAMEYGQGGGSQAGGSQGGGSQAGGSQAGGSQGGGGDCASTDSGGATPAEDLSPVTGQLEHPEAARMIQAARAGDKVMAAHIERVLTAARQGDKRAEPLAHGIRVYLRAHPEFKGEILEGRAVHLSHGHPLTDKRIRAFSAEFGKEAETFLEHVREPYGPVIDYRPAYVGLMVGRAQAYQAIRYPGTPLSILSERVSRELTRK